MFNWKKKVSGVHHFLNSSREGRDSRQHVVIDSKKTTLEAQLLHTCLINLLRCCVFALSSFGLIFLLAWYEGFLTRIFFKHEIPGTMLLWKYTGIIFLVSLFNVLLLREEETAVPCLASLRLMEYMVQIHCQLHIRARWLTET